MQIAETLARRVAELLRKRLGDDFDVIVSDMKAVNFKQLKLELDRVPVDERCETLRLEREAQAAARAAAAAELPEPDGPEERAILSRYGF